MHPTPWNRTVPPLVCLRQVVCTLHLRVARPFSLLWWAGWVSSPLPHRARIYSPPRLPIRYLPKFSAVRWKQPQTPLRLSLITLFCLSILEEPDIAPILWRDCYHRRFFLCKCSSLCSHSLCGLLRRVIHEPAAASRAVSGALSMALLRKYWVFNLYSAVTVPTQTSAVLVENIGIEPI